MENSPTFSYTKDPPGTQGSRAQALVIIPWGKGTGAPGLLDQDSGVLAGLLGNLKHRVQPPEHLQCVWQNHATGPSLE